MRFLRLARFLGNSYDLLPIHAQFIKALVKYFTNKLTQMTNR